MRCGVLGLVDVVDVKYLTISYQQAPDEVPLLQGQKSPSPDYAILVINFTNDYFVEGELGSNCGAQLVTQALFYVSFAFDATDIHQTSAENKKR